MPALGSAGSSPWCSRSPAQPRSPRTTPLAASRCPTGPIEALRSEKAELEASIADLSKRGGKIKFNTCGGRLCIEASSNQGETAPKWEGAAWHNEQNGVALVIPRGY